jgi:glycine dehydrogenase subunit 1
MPEQAVFEHLRELAARNVDADSQVSFLGAGFYDHYVPALIDMLTERSEFLTPYTPYQPEISQGSLQVMFEYQTAASELTGLPVSNAAVYDGPSAVGAAAYMAKLENGRRRVVISAGVHPHAVETLHTLAPGYGIEVVEVGLTDGLTDLERWRAAIDEETCAAIFATPNFYGAIEDGAALTAAAKEAGGEKIAAVVAVDPITLGVLAPPGEWGADVAVGEGQALGNRLDYGGPSFGLFTASDRFLRRMPGRIAGETVDVAYLGWLGREGIVELGELLARRTHYARQALAGLDGVELLHAAAVVREFAVRLDADVDAVRRRCIEAGVNPGVDLQALTGREQDKGGLLVAITERRSRADIDRLADVLGAAVAAEREAVAA